MDCSTGPRVITDGIRTWHKGMESECCYCGERAVFDGEKWVHVPHREPPEIWVNGERLNRVARRET